MSNVNYNYDTKQGELIFTIPENNSWLPEIKQYYKF
jgi:hypothetical protein